VYSKSAPKGALLCYRVSMLEKWRPVYAKPGDDGLDIRDEDRVERKLEKGLKFDTMSEIVSFLQQQKFNYRKEYYKFLLDVAKNPISAKDIQAAVSLPFEVSLTEQKGRVILVTGDEDQSAGDPGNIDRRNSSRLSMHTHPLSRDGSADVVTPSFSDVYISEFAGPTTPLLLAHAEGLIHYRKPSYDPINKQLFDGEARDAMLIYGEAHGIDVFGFDRGRLKSYFSMSNEEKVVFQRRFAEETKMIIQEANWNEVEKIANMMNIVNLKT